MKKTGYDILQLLRSQEETILFNTIKKCTSGENKLSISTIISELRDNGIIPSINRSNYILTKWIKRGIYDVGDSNDIYSGHLTEDAVEKMIRYTNANGINPNESIERLKIIPFVDILFICNKMGYDYIDIGRLPKHINRIITTDTFEINLDIYSFINFEGSSIFEDTRKVMCKIMSLISEI